ncbi:hypothetical protein [uncultured Endozoicomonas sp.]|uniref:hypothetical protein n=1 Tax=uncultured Endozoicomonas sp. TaxID=432652 RepID=UPI00262C8470|nr:hypothetical protein [uncultured Endozoicomonas sp.]
MDKVTWYTAGLNKYLSDNGYVHFLTKEKMRDDFEQDIAFTFNEENKTFGKCDVIDFSRYSEAEKHQKEFKELIRNT